MDNRLARPLIEDLADLRRRAGGLLTSAAMSDRSRLSTTLVLSMLLHLMLLSLVQRSPLPKMDLPNVEDLIDVDLVSLPKPPPPAPVKAPPQPAPEPAPEPEPRASLPESRIVPVPEAGREVPSDQARFLSDRDNVVDEESVRRGLSPDKAGQDDPGQHDDPMPPDPVPPEAVVPVPPPAPPAPPVAKPAPARAGESARAAVDVAKRPAAPTGAEGPRDIALGDLLPRPGDIAMADPDLTAAEPEAEKAPVRRDLLPARRVQFSSGTGISTLLPSIRDGDVTLLNTKAYEFAPFVRRVAVRVFQHLQIALLEAARRGATGSGNEHAAVRATMTPDGRFVRAVLRESHSETRMSVPRLLHGLIGPKTFFDENPPPGAVAADGDIHFDIQVDLRVWAAAGGPRGPLTQFEGMLGVGLGE